MANNDDRDDWVPGRIAKKLFDRDMAKRFEKREFIRTANTADCKKKVLNGLTDRAPGPEVGTRRFRHVILESQMRKRHNIHTVVMAGIEGMQRTWSWNFGPDYSPANRRSLLNWTETWLELEERKKEWMENEQIQALLTSNPTLLDDAAIAEIWVAGGITSLCKMTLDAVRIDWGPRSADFAIFDDNHWNSINTLKEWAEALSSMEKNHDDNVKELNTIENELWKMGWNYRNNRWRDDNDKVWAHLCFNMSLAESEGRLMEV